MIKKLINRITPEIDILLNHKFINNLLEGKYKKNDLKLFAEQYYLLSNEFVNLLLYGALNIKLDENRLPIISNLWDEHGRGSLYNTHRELLKKFLIGIDKTIDFNQIKPLYKTEQYIKAMRDLIKESSEWETLSILGTACESITDRQYELIYHALLKNYLFTKDELVFFTEHIIHDEKHSLEINNILEIFLTTNDRLEESISVAKKALSLENTFWDGLEEEYEKLN